MLKLLAIAFVVAVIGAVGYGVSLPDTYQVERALRMKAPPEKIYPYIGDFDNWGAWSPWVAKDPSMAITISEKSSGMGAVYEWSGNADVGEGRIEMVSTQPPSGAQFNLTMFEPYSAKNVIEFSLHPFGDYTKVVWLVRGSMTTVAKIFSVFKPMDAMLGPDLEAGLASLKALTEN